MAKLVPLFVLAISLLWDQCLAGDLCVLGGVVIQVGTNLHSYKGVPSNPDTLPRSSSEQLKLQTAFPPDACRPLLKPVAGSAVLVQRGSCPFGLKAQHLQQAKAAAMLVANTDDDCMFMDLNMTQAELNALPPVVSVSKGAGLQLEEASKQNETIALWLPQYSSFDFNVVLLWIMAVGTFVVAGIWAGHDSVGNEHAYLKAEGSQEGYASMWQIESQMITQGGAVAFLIIASGSLLLLYFFLDKAFYIILMVLFSLSGIQALAAALTPLCAWLLPHQTINPPIGRVPVHAIMSLGLSIATVAVWLFFRTSSWAWALQDVLGMSLIIMVLRQLRLPNLKVACVLLPLSFAYDVFWVFIQPHLTHGDSVMVKVATGGDEHWQLPMLLKIPAFRLSPAVGPVILGFGDVLLPGLLGVYTRTFDLYHNCSWQTSYFWPNVAGYGIGLLLTYLALWFEIGGSQGQPALLYLIPCTLGLTLVLAASRKHFTMMCSDDTFATVAADTEGSADLEANASLTNVTRYQEL